MAALDCCTERSNARPQYASWGPSMGTPCAAILEKSGRSTRGRRRAVPRLPRSNGRDGSTASGTLGTTAKPSHYRLRHAGSQLRSESTPAALREGGRGAPSPVRLAGPAHATYSRDSPLLQARCPSDVDRELHFHRNRGSKIDSPSLAAEDAYAKRSRLRDVRRDPTTDPSIASTHAGLVRELFAPLVRHVYSMRGLRRGPDSHLSPFSP